MSFGVKPLVRIQCGQGDGLAAYDPQCTKTCTTTAQARAYLRDGGIEVDFDADLPVGWTIKSGFGGGYRCPEHSKEKEEPPLNIREGFVVWCEGLGAGGLRVATPRAASNGVHDTRASNEMADTCFRSCKGIREVVS
jgi:hypothetical protein